MNAQSQQMKRSSSRFALFAIGMFGVALQAHSEPIVRQRRATVGDVIMFQRGPTGSETYTFTLFDKIKFVGLVERRTEPSFDSVARSGTLKGTRGTFTVVDRREKQYVSIHDGARVYEVEPAEFAEPDIVLVREIDSTRVLQCTVGQDRPQKNPPQTSAGGVVPCGGLLAALAADAPTSEAACLMRPSDEHVQIDALVVYSSRNLASEAGRATIEGRILRYVDQTNQAFAASNVNAQLRIASTSRGGSPKLCIFDVNYSETGSNAVDLDNLVRTDDTELNDVHVLRDECSADIGILMVRLAADGGGRACVMEHRSAAFAPYAFAVVDNLAAAADYAFTHEVGHLIGAGHDEENGFPGVCADSAGWRFKYGSWFYKKLYKTVMAYRRETPPYGIPTLHFSDPTIKYRGVSRTGMLNKANNAHALRLTAKTVSQFK